MPFAPLVFLGPLADWLRAAGVEVEILRTGSLRSPWAIRRASRQISAMANKFDLVHAQYGSACALATMLATKIPRLLTIRGSDWNLLTESWHWHWLHTRLARIFSQMAMQRADGVLAVSNRIVCELQSLHPELPIHYLPTPVDFAKFRPATSKERSARSALATGVNPASCWVLFNTLNLWNPVKRYRLARDAIAVARSRRGLSIELILASSIPNERIPMLTRSCDVILSTSENEGWPNCIKEALASGIPFIATDTSDLREIAEVDSRCQVVAADAQAIADALATFIEVRNSGELESLRDHVRHMQLPAIGKKIITIYEDTLRKAGA